METKLNEYEQGVYDGLNSAGMSVAATSYKHRALQSRCNTLDECLETQLIKSRESNKFFVAKNMELVNKLSQAEKDRDAFRELKGNRNNTLADNYLKMLNENAKLKVDLLRVADERNKLKEELQSRIAGLESELTVEPKKNKQLEDKNQGLGNQIHNLMQTEMTLKRKLELANSANEYFRDQLHMENNLLNGKA